MRRYVENSMTNGLELADVSITNDILHVQLINRPLWFNVIIPTDLIDMFKELLMKNESVGFRQWYIADSNEPIVQDHITQANLDTMHTLEEQGMDVTALKDFTVVKTKSDWRI